jgi:hypothetical protein
MKTKLKTLLATSLLILGGLGGFAAAKGPGHGHGHGGKKALIEKFDTNKDGTLDDAERAAMRGKFQAMKARRKAKLLAKFDANRNGVLDPAERTTIREQKAARRFAKLDANGDGTLTLDEFKAGRGKHRHRGMRKRP